MSEEEMESEIEIYLSHIIQPDFPLPKAIKMMYEKYKEYKQKDQNWEKMYDEDQIIKNYKSILNNARANWIYEDYEILLKFWLLYEKETEKNKIIENRFKRELNITLKSAKNHIKKGNKKCAYEEYKKYKNLKETVNWIFYSTGLLKG